MIVRLVSYTEEPERTVALAGRLTRSSKSYEELSEELSDIPHCQKFIRKLIRAGHESVLEHASFTFYISEISRACSHQIVRHRIASYSQKSQRYEEEEEGKFIVPESISKNMDSMLLSDYLGCINVAEDIYHGLCENGVPPEDARYILPQAISTTLIMTMNARELRHFFKLRLSKHAQWEIRELAKSMLDIVYAIAPSLFEDIYEGD